MKMAHVQELKVLPLLGPIDVAAVATASQYIDIDQCVGLIEFEVAFGAITATDSSTSEMAVTVQASTAGGTDAGTAIAFQYALSSAVATDSMGAITAATSSGTVVNSSTGDNKLLMVYVDPAVVAAVGTGYRYANVKVDGTAGVTAAIVGVVGRYLPRFSQASQPSST